MRGKMMRKVGLNGRDWIAGAGLAALALLIMLWIVAERRAVASCRAYALPGTETWLVLGQSNAANHAELRHAAGPRVAAFDGRACVAARDPLPGADGVDGSLWTPLAQAWVDDRRAERVLLAVVAQHSTSVAEWQPGTRLHDRAAGMIEALRGRGLRVTRILWVQGEADVIHQTSGDSYRRGLESTLEPLHLAAGAPAYISLIGRCRDDMGPAIRSAQARLIADHDWALAGPDLDLIGPEGRYQRCHFARRGQDRAVALWLDALRGTKLKGNGATSNE